MKKAGILTYHSANNYGTCLQAYALQEAVRKAGCEAEIIRYQGEKLSVPPAAHRSAKAVITDFIVKTGAKVVKASAQPAFESFRRKYYNYSPEVTDSTVGTLNDRYDLFLSGSDQVWNSDIAGNLDIYLQTFVADDAKKGSYAASFGVSKIPDTLRPRYAEALAKFAYLGIREPAGAELVKELTGRDSTVVLDPTQLLTREDWRKVMEPVGSGKPYIMVYQLGFSSRLLEKAKQLSDETGLRLVFVPFPEGKPLKGHYYPRISPAQWLYLMDHASYVVTNSFHGTAFSIGFEKDFYTDISPNLSALSSRILNLLERYGLQNRAIGEHAAPWTEKIDYDRVRPLYEQDRAESMGFLKNALEEN